MEVAKGDAVERPAADPADMVGKDRVGCLKLAFIKSKDLTRRGGVDGSFDSMYDSRFDGAIHHD